MQSLLIFGRQPALGLAEAESLYGAEKVQPITSAALLPQRPGASGHAAAGKYSQTAILDVDPCLLAFDRLGGSVKFCKVLTTLDTTDWQQIEKFLLQVSPGHSQRLPEGKMLLGLSAIGFNIGMPQLQATGLKLKKAIRKTGRPVRLVPNKTAELSSPQVIHNKLTGPNGWEIYIIRSNNPTSNKNDSSKNNRRSSGEQGNGETIIAQTVRVQDIESYTRRDRERPARDTKVGMLPPKLAQIIINLAIGELPEEASQSICEIPPDVPIPAVHYAGVHLLDPFCGTGVVLQEASLMGYDVQGSDIDERMITFTRRNLQWLLTQPENRITIHAENTTEDYAHVSVGDATTHQWTPAPTVVASETYLGRPFTSPPTPEILNQTITDCNLIIKKFLKNMHGQIRPGTRLCLAIPAWQVKPDQFKHLPLIDQISELGYNQVSLKHVRHSDLIYYRANQIVARQLLVITRN